MKKHVLQGTGVALITPFKDDKSIDIPALEKLVHYQIENGVDYLVVLGTTAETATLSENEKEIVKETIKKANQNRLPMILGIGGNNTQAVINSIKNTDYLIIKLFYLFLLIIIAHHKRVFINTLKPLQKALHTLYFCIMFPLAQARIWKQKLPCV